MGDTSYMSTVRYDIGSSREDSPGLKYITHSLFENEWLSVVHSHAVAELIYVIAGEGSIVYGLGRREISRDDFIVVPPHLMHTEISSSQQPLEYYCLGVSNVTLASPKEDYDPVLELGVNRQAVLGMIEGIFREMQRRQPEYEMMAHSLFEQLLVLLIRRKVIDIGLEEAVDMRSNIADVKQYIDSHYAEQINLDKLAELACLSKFHLIREFRQAMGTSPIDYLQETRVTEAKRLLAGTEFSVGDIAEAVGFSSASYFAQRFKAVSGMSPMTFRRRSHGMS